MLTVPEEQLSAEKRCELIARSAEDARDFATQLLSRPVSFHLMEHGVYEKRRNAAEAEYIAELVRTLLMGETRYSSGIVAFSEVQQGEIERAIRRLADEDQDFSELLDAELEREEDGQFMGLLLKNLENIQGDEGDIIIMSVCYGSRLRWAHTHELWADQYVGRREAIECGILSCKTLHGSGCIDAFDGDYQRLQRRGELPEVLFEVRGGMFRGTFGISRRIVARYERPSRTSVYGRNRPQSTDR